MRVIATATGFDNLSIREPGDIFEMPDGATGPWFEPVDKPSKTVKTVKTDPVDPLA